MWKHHLKIVYCVKNVQITLCYINNYQGFYVDKSKEHVVPSFTSTKYIHNAIDVHPIGIASFNADEPQCRQPLLAHGWPEIGLESTQCWKWPFCRTWCSWNCGYGLCHFGEMWQCFTERIRMQPLFGNFPLLLFRALHLLGMLKFPYPDWQTSVSSLQELSLGQHSKPQSFLSPGLCEIRILREPLLLRLFTYSDSENLHREKFSPLNARISHLICPNFTSFSNPRGGCNCPPCPPVRYAYDNDSELL